MSTDRSMKDKVMAAHLRAKGVRRTSGQCPWGCGRSVTNGGEHLLAHLNGCKGRPKAVGR